MRKTCRNVAASICVIGMFLFLILIVSAAFTDDNKTRHSLKTIIMVDMLIVMICRMIAAETKNDKRLDELEKSDKLKP